MINVKIKSEDLPGLYQSANQASIAAQRNYFIGLRWYLVLLICAAYASYSKSGDSTGALVSAALFLITLGILVFLRMRRPDDIWYNGRAVAESVKTRSWRWMMRAEPYQDSGNLESVSKQFISDLKIILDQNKNLSHSLQATSSTNEPITKIMKVVRTGSVTDRLSIYLDQRVQDQIDWYSLKAKFNKGRAQQWFWVSVALHGIAIAMLLYRIKDPSISLPVEVVATSAGAVLTWLQAKKHNELNSAYALTAHEIALIKGEADSVHNENELSEYVINSESAFSREHTQWAARKLE